MAAGGASSQPEETAPPYVSTLLSSHGHPLPLPCRFIFLLSRPSRLLFRPSPQKYVCLSSTSLPALNSSDGSFGSASSAHPATKMLTTKRASKKYPHSVLSVILGLQKICSFFQQVESFWSIWTHLTPPSVLQPTTDYLLFHIGVHKPVWEDPLNLSGGKWIIRLRKGIADRLWEDLVMAVIGDQFDECAGRNGADPPEAEDGVHYPEICGCTISVRQHEDIISIWNRFEADFRVREKIRSVVCTRTVQSQGLLSWCRDTLKRVLNLPPTTILEYKTNNGQCQRLASVLYSYFILSIRLDAR